MMPIEGRLTLCNLSIDFSANSGFISPDDATFQYVNDRPFAPKGEVFDRARSYWKTLATDPGASFDREVYIDVDGLAPYVTWGTSLDQVVALDGVIPDPGLIADPSVRALHERALEYVRLKPGTPIDGLPIDVAYIGSCTNSRISDLRSAAAILKGRKVAPGITAICVPGSTPVKLEAEAEGLDKIFKDAGFEWHESGCAMCSADGRTTFADRRVISTTNRNFEGRQGPQTRTHLASPATVAASAVTGKITDARKMMS
jgi:3-isopropylmalate/(R)-2-methylmalate dehydratase large subunit